MTTLPPPLIMATIHLIARNLLFDADFMVANVAFVFVLCARQISFLFVFIVSVYLVL
jgi:hypothetical protein